jgi:hypothetical protein
LQELALIVREIEKYLFLSRYRAVTSMRLIEEPARGTHRSQAEPAIASGSSVGRLNRNLNLSRLYLARLLKWAPPANRLWTPYAFTAAPMEVGVTLLS